MSANTSLAIRIATIFDRRGVKDADKGIAGLEKSFKKLAGAAGIGLTAAAFGKFIKSSIKAFAEEERSVAMLSNALTNLGMGKQSEQIYAYIDALQMATGVADDDLRPAFQKLATAGLNAADAQSVLGLALNVSAGSGKDLSTVTAALSKAVGGNTAGLSKLGIGLSKTELKTMTLDEILLKLSDTYKNSAAKAAETFSGKLAKLNVAIGTAKEAIGKGFIDGLMLATGAVDITDLQTKIVNLGTTLATVFVATGNLIHDNWNLIKQLGIALIATFTAAKVYAGVAALISIINKLKAAYIALRTVGFAAAVATAAAINPVGGVIAATALVATIIAGNIALDKFNKTKEDANKNPFVVPDFTGLTGVDYGDAKRLEKLKIAAAKAQEKAAKESAKMQKLSKIFDLDQIQIYAALQGKLTDEERNRVELQLALLDENVQAADYLSKKLAVSQGQTSMLSTFLRTLPDAKNPFDKWGDYLKAIELEAKRIGALTFGTTAITGVGGGAAEDAGKTTTNTPSITNPYAGLSDFQIYGPQGGLGAGVIAGVNVKVVLDGKELTSIITDTQINDSLSGSFNQVNRGGGFKGAVAL
jgi:hypothetical protein